MHAVDAGFKREGFKDIADRGDAGVEIRRVRTAHRIGRLFLVKAGGCVGLIGAFGFGHVACHVGGAIGRLNVIPADTASLAYPPSFPRRRTDRHILRHPREGGDPTPEL